MPPQLHYSPSAIEKGIGKESESPKGDAAAAPRATMNNKRATLI